MREDGINGNQPAFHLFLYLVCSVLFLHPTIRRFINDSYKPIFFRSIPFRIQQCQLDIKGILRAVERAISEVDVVLERHADQVGDLSVNRLLKIKPDGDCKHQAQYRTHAGVMPVTHKLPSSVPFDKRCHSCLRTYSLSSLRAAALEIGLLLGWECYFIGDK